MQSGVELDGVSGSPVADMEKATAQDIQGVSYDNKAELELDIQELISLKQRYENDINQFLKEKLLLWRTFWRLL